MITFKNSLAQQNIFIAKVRYVDEKLYPMTSELGEYILTKTKNKYGHTIKSDNVKAYTLYKNNREIVLKVFEPTPIKHNNSESIMLEKGTYCLYKEKNYTND